MAKGPVSRAEFERLQRRVSSIEADMSRVGVWIAGRQRAEAQLKADDEARPTIHERDDEGYPWLIKSQ